MSCFEFNMWIAYFEQQREELENEKKKQQGLRFR